MSESSGTWRTRDIEKMFVVILFGGRKGVLLMLLKSLGILLIVLSPYYVRAFGGITCLDIRPLRSAMFSLTFRMVCMVCSLIDSTF